MKRSIAIQNVSSQANPGVREKIDKFYSMKRKLLDLPLGAIPDDLHKKVLKTLDHAAETYSCFGVEVAKEDIPRDATFVCGPSFVSEGHAQPIDSGGRPMFPVLQVDLDWLGKLTERKFKQEILQLWWSPFEVLGKVITIPKHQVFSALAIPLLLPDDVLDEALDWIPFEWVCDDPASAYQIIGCENIGVTFPSFDWMLDDCSHHEINSNHWDLICGLSNDYQFHSGLRSGPGKSIFRVFGHFRNHACSPWDLAPQMSFLHTPQWSQGMMDANIFMGIGDDGLISNFSFAFGR